MTLAYAQREPLTSNRHPAVRALGVIIRSLTTLVVLTVIVGGLYLIGVNLGGPGAIYFLLAGLLALVALARSRRVLQRRRVAMIFSLVHRGMSLGVPLPEFLAAAAEGERGALRKRLQTIVTELLSGAPIERALIESLPELDARQLALLLSAQSSGGIQHLLIRLTREHAAERADQLHSGRTLLVYTLFSTMVVFAVLGLVALFVLPKIHTIQRDFGLPASPWMRSSALSTSALILLALTFTCLLAVLFRTVWDLLRIRATAAAEPSLFSARKQRLADFYFSVSDQIAAGRPLTELAASPQITRGPSRLQGEVGAFVGRLAAGEPFSVAARDAKLPRRDIQLLASVPNGPQLASTFRLLAEHHDRQLLRQRHWTLLLGVILLNLLATASVLLAAHFTLGVIAELTDTTLKLIESGQF